MIRKDIFSKIGLFNEQLKVSEDLDLLIRIALNFKIGFIDEVLASVRLHHNHLMRETPRHQVWLSSAKVYESYADEIGKHVPDPKKYFARLYSIAGNSALLSGERKKAFELHCQAVVKQPLALKGYKDCVRCFLPMAYLKMRHEKSLKVEIPKAMRNY